MAQFDVYRVEFYRDPAVPFAVALQSDVLSLLKTEMLAPLRRVDVIPSMGRLSPFIEFAGERLMVSVTELVSMPRSVLGAPVGNLEPHRDRIIAALDFLFTGI